MFWSNINNKTLICFLGGVLLISISIIVLIILSRKRNNKKNNSAAKTGMVIHSIKSDGKTKIKSREIVSFDYEFSTDSIFYRGYNIPYNYCKLSLKKESDRAAMVKIFLAGIGIESDYRLDLTVGPEKLVLLQELAERENLASMSGTYRKVDGIPHNVGSKLLVEYASGERISASDNTGHVIPNLTTSLIYDFFRELVLEADHEDFAGGHHRLRSNQEYKVIARGNWLDEQGNFFLEFNGDQLRIVKQEEILYDDKFSIAVGILLNQEGMMKFGPFRGIYLTKEEIVVEEFGKKDLVFKSEEGYFLQMIQGCWQDSESKYRLEFSDTNLKIYKEGKLLLDEEIFVRHRSIGLKDKEDEDIGPFGNLYAEIGSLQVLPYQGEGEDKRIVFYPAAD